MYLPSVIHMYKKTTVSLSLRKCFKIVFLFLDVHSYTGYESNKANTDICILKLYCKVKLVGPRPDFYQYYTKVLLTLQTTSLNQNQEAKITDV